MNDFVLTGCIQNVFLRNSKKKTKKKEEEEEVAILLALEHNTKK